GNILAVAFNRQNISRSFIAGSAAFSLALLLCLFDVGSGIDGVSGSAGRTPRVVELSLQQ
ncbi:MAG: hypothetical protein WAW42_16410, partial [Candidatus Competibacteraceae bacterium]